MTNPPFQAEVLRVRQLARPAWDPEVRMRTAVHGVLAQLDPIRSRSSLLSSFAREASPSEPVRAAYAIRWVELGSGIAATGIARSRRRRVTRPLLQGRA